MGNRMKDTLVIDAFLQAYGKERPEAGLIVHTNQGFQYTGGNFRAILSANHSNSRKGNPYIVQLNESSFREQTIQHLNKLKRKFLSILSCITTQKIHSSLGYLSPSQFEKQNP